jgi:uncharacterized protein YbgA (DUF1722 family)/uncharacterized protein YbbK (DUF523 family)
MSDRPVRVGISSCLLGERVRFDGGHKRNVFLTDTLGRLVEWVPVCPEVECGLGTPRESMRLVQTDRLRLVTVKTGVDLTSRLVDYADRRVEELATADLSGYVLKKDSPSCGLERVKVYGAQGMPAKAGRGLFAARLAKRLPDLPLEEEGRLSDPRLRDNFLERVFAYWRLRGLFAPAWTIGDLVRFHTGHKLILLAHSPEGYRRLGRLVAQARRLPRVDLARQYSREFMESLRSLATVRRHVNVLQHMAGYFKTTLDGETRAELSNVIQEYRQRLVPLAVPVTLLRHHIRAQRVPYLAGQLYLDPYPRELTAERP